MTMARLSGGVAGDSTGPRAPTLIAGMVSCWSGNREQGGDPGQPVTNAVPRARWQRS